VTRSLARKRVPRMVTVSPGAAVMRSRLLIDGDGSSALVYVNAPSSDAETVAQTTPTVGAAFAKVNALASDAVAPPSQRIETATVAAGCGGVVATSVVALVAFERTAGRPPNHATQFASSRVPVNVTSVPPALVPPPGETRVSAEGMIGSCTPTASTADRDPHAGESVAVSVYTPRDFATTVSRAACPAGIDAMGGCSSAPAVDARSTTETGSVCGGVIDSDTSKLCPWGT